MDLETSARDYSAALTSARANERKKSAEALKDLLTRNALPSLLSKNTLKKRGFSWNDLFDDINDCIMKETEKYETSKTFNTVTGPLCTSLLHRCIAGANKGKAYVKCDKIMDACLFILKNNRLTKAIGDAYLNLLHKHVLSCDHYLGHITPSHWNELLDVCITVCLSSASKLDNYTKLRLLLLTIKSGTKYCQLVTHLKDSLSDLQKCLLQIHNDKKVQEVVIEIVIILLEMLSTESRLLMCQFSESLLSVILKFYDHSLEQKKKASLFKLLELIVMLHHPEGKLPKQDGSLANNWETWQRHLNNILEIITLEISFLQKVRKQNECSETKNSHFSSLAAALYYQIFHPTVDLGNDNDAGTSSKRQKTASNKYKSFTDLIYQLQLNYMPWLAILHMYVKHYGATISAIDYLSVIKIIEVILNSSNHHFNWEIFEEVTCMIIENLNSNSRNIGDLDDYFLSLWNSCVRNSTSVNLANKALHAIMQLLLKTKILKYQNVQPLIKLYLERGMPVNDSSVKTINKILNKFFNQCSSLEQRTNFLCWFVDGDIASVGEASKELLLRLISNDNTNIIESPDLPDPDHLFDILFYSIDKSILFSEFELETPTNEPSNLHVPKQSELNIEMNSLLLSSLENKLSLDTEQFKSKSMNLLRFSQSINIAISYLDLMMKYKFLSTDEIRQLQLYASLRSSLNIMFVSLVSTLKSNESIANKIKLLQYMRVLLTNEYVSILSLEIRRSIEEDFFHYANNILTSEQEMEDDVVYEGDENEMNTTTMKHNCIYTLAAYCRIRANYREELLELILDPKLYNFDSVWDVKCASRCIEILSEPGAEEPPLDLIFMFMQYICKVLFRVPDVTFGLLNVLMKILELLWAHDDNMKQNSFIMIRGYLERCDKLFYPPHLAALIFKCAAKMVLLNSAQITDVDDIFIRSIIKKSRSDIHCIRIYCCYLLEKLIHHTDFNIAGYLSDISEIFTNVPQRQQIILKDESTNRTLTVLHTLVVLATAKKSLIREIVTLILSLQNEKSLDKKIVKKVLNIITTKVDNKTIDVYLNRNVLSILQFWFAKKFDLNSLPLEFFNISNQAEFIDKHMKWLISADVLWRHGGNINASEVLKRAKSTLTVSESEIIELCFCNIIVLCLPYIVTEKYGLRYTPAQNEHQFKQSMINANRMFQMTRQILDNEKWSNLFVENVGELLLLTATHLSDYVEARDQFQIGVLEKPEAYQYPTLVFASILTYFGQLTDGNIMLYLCENQPVAIFKILLKLWENVLQEDVLELKVLCVHAFKTFVECIPLVSPSDAFVCNYVCHCFGYAIKKSRNDKEVKILALGLKSTLLHFLPGEVNILRNALSQLMSTLIIKKEEGFENECDDLLNYLVVDMKDYLKEQEDVVDFIRSMSSQHSVENLSCSTLAEFSEKLKTYKVALNSPSYESISNLHQFLKINKKHVNGLSKYLETVRFSEDCGTSLIHQIIYKLNNIMKSVNDNKTVIEACNCLSEIGTYDLKTLVTLPPTDTKGIVAAQPRQSFAVAAVASLSEVLFDENPLVTNKVAKTLNRLLKYKEGQEAVDSGEVDKQILKPFTSPDQGNEVATFQINDAKFNGFASAEFMIPDDNETHSQWLVKHTIAVLEVLNSESNYFTSLGEVCLLKSQVCQRVLPALIGLLLYFSSEKHIQIISEQINNFFKYIWEISFDDNVENSADSSNYKRTDVINQNHKMMIQNMLEVVNFVRLQRKHYKSRGNRLETLNYLKLDYDKVAWAATVAEQNLSAIYYGELWTVAINDGVPPSSPHATTALQGGKDLQRILRKSFVSIGELDAVDGCGTAHLTIEDEKRKHLTNTGQYLDALLMHDIALSCARADPNLRRGVVRSLHKSGMHHLALQYIKSLPENDQLSDIKYECLSFLGDWSDFVDTRDLEEKCAVPNSNTQSVLKAFRYACLKDCLNIQMKPEFQDRLVQPLNSAKLAVSKMCQHLNMENCQSVYKVLSKLHLFTDIEDYFAVRCDKLPLYDLLEKWRVENLPAFQDFKHLEDLICQRNIILEHSAKSYSTSLKDIVTLQLQYAELSLNNQRIQMAQRLLAVVKKMQTSKEVALLESQISWAKGHKDIALSLLSNIVSSPDSERSSDTQKTAVSLRQYGLWMAESKSDNARDIINKYLKKSLDLTRGDDTKTRQKVYFDIAKFADAEYKQVVTYMNSAIFENKVKCLESMKDTASTLKQTQMSLSKEEKKALLTSERFEKLEEADISSTKAEKETFLQLAMRYYLLSLKECDENNLSVFRVISLWLDNPSLQLDADSEPFERLLHGIPSRKFVAVLPQLAPRLSDEESAFADNLRRIIRRCALEHPHHTLPILFSLKNSDKDKCILNASQAAGRMQRNAPQEPRVVAAEVLVRQVASESAVLAVVVAQMEQLCDAIISFANFKPKAKSQQQKIPAAENIHRLSHLDSIPIPTDTVPIRSDCDYGNLSTLVSFDDYFELVGGINCPKKVNCRGSDGCKKILLIKGEDDLRQDAVMQQVFNIVNTLLENNTITNRNKLLIRTYKVVPMSRQSGVLEWCVGTMPIGAYLVGSAGNSGAHARYRPKDISCSAARQLLNKCHEQRKSNKAKLEVFINLLKQFKPVFHYFFTEHYLDAVTWYERRLAYTKSVATSSMVGYILGLGDRHVQNILIDEKTAEVIHIDFGIAFDQGRALPTPETIPFRLTQDMIAGFGCSGVEGIFRRCCEKTMQLLRDNQETLLTILEVLLCDPLYSWTVANAAQPTAPTPANKNTTCTTASNSGLAERALLAVSSKLSGTEGGVAGGVAVPGQVARLITDAADPTNLSRVFPGWQPYL